MGGARYRACMTDFRYAAAWVPDDASRGSLDEAFALAAGWIKTQARSHGGGPVLVTPSQHQLDAFDEITRFAGTYSATTPRSSRRWDHRGAVLAYVPDFDAMNLAMSLAHGSSLVVVETREYPLIGWAVEVGAVNLVTGAATPDTRTADQRIELKRVHSYGNNGWARGFGQEQAKVVLRDLLGELGASKDIILGYMVAQGQGRDAIARLDKLIDELERRR
jgi:hypothetical protein